MLKNFHGKKCVLIIKIKTLCRTDLNHYFLIAKVGYASENKAEQIELSGDVTTPPTHPRENQMTPPQSFVLVAKPCLQNKLAQAIPSLHQSVQRGRNTPDLTTPPKILTAPPVIIVYLYTYLLLIIISLLPR